MSEFLLDEAMGYNRRQQMDEVGHLANAGLDDRLYDDDFFANRPEPGGQQDGTIVQHMGSFAGSEAGGDQQDLDHDPEVDRDDGKVLGVIDDTGSDADEEGDLDPLVQEGRSRDGGDSEYQSARSHLSGDGQGLIQEEPAGQQPAANVQQPNLPPLIAPAGRPAPRTEFSQEDMFDRTQWDTGRSNRVRGKYLSTFGERMRAIGGGFGGFFGALFGRGMRRANEQAPKLRWEAARRQQEQARRGQEREADRTRGPLRSALKTRLANPEPITKLSTYPREPGVQYDEQAAGAAHAGYMGARNRFQAFDERIPGRGMEPQSVYDKLVERAETERYDIDLSMRAAYAGFDQTTGTRRMFRHPLRHPDPSESDMATLNALITANHETGRDIHANRNRAQAPRVRFKDGADDAVGLPVNDANEDYTNKPMPTGVRFFPAPIGGRGLMQSVSAELRAFQQTPEFGALSPEAQEEQKKAKKSELAGPVREYVDSLGATGHPDEISDQQAVANERFAWPVRAQMQRMPTDNLQRESMAQINQAMSLERTHQQAGTDPLEDDAFRDHYLRSEIGGQVELDRWDDRNAGRHRDRHIQTAHLPANTQALALPRIAAMGHRVDQTKTLSQQAKNLPLGFFDQFLAEGYDDAEEERLQAAQPQPVPAGGGGGGGGIIEEEELQQ